jgi:hypothetical protein
LSYFSGQQCCCRACATSGTSRANEPLRLPDRFSVRIRDDAARRSAVLNAPVDHVWALLPVVHQQLGFVAAPATNTRERLFMTPQMTIRNRLYREDMNSDYFNCGTGITGPRADAYQVSFAIVMKVSERAANETLVEIVIDGLHAAG